MNREEAIKILEDIIKQRNQFNHFNGTIVIIEAIRALNEMGVFKTYSRSSGPGSP